MSRAVFQLFEQHQHGIAIYGVVARALSKTADGRFYLFDSHSINRDGLPATEFGTGKAALFTSTSWANLARKLFDLMTRTPPVDLQDEHDPRNQFTIDPIRFQVA